MALSRVAQEFADEIRSHDWQDAPYRLDRAGHRRTSDSRADNSELLTENETRTLVGNVVFVVGQVLKHQDPNLDLEEFATACGAGWMSAGVLEHGIRFDHDSGHALAPGQWWAP